MKTRDALGIAGRFALSRSSLLPVLGIAACLFCLCFAATALAKVRQEQAAPCELTVTAERVKLTPAALTLLEQTSGVMAVTPAVQIPVTLSAGDYAAELTITGLRGAYVRRPVRQGALFAGRGAMPYLVLNEAACRQFKKTSIDFSGKEPDLQWLGMGMLLRLDETNSLPARVCGILTDDTPDDPPMVLADYETAQALLRTAGAPTDPQLAYVRVRNSGAAQPAADAIARLGFAVAMPDEGIQQAWAAGQKEASYLLLLSLACLLLAIVRMRGGRRLAFCRNQGMLADLHWMGLRQGTLRMVVRLQTMLVALLGCIAGLVLLAVPALLQQSVVQGTCFALPVPVWAWGGCALVISIAFCIGAPTGRGAALHASSGR